MTVTDQFREFANKIAERAQRRRVELDRELAEIQLRRVQIKTERDMARGALQRLSTYQIKFGKEWLCPQCWIEQGRLSPLAPIPSDSRNDDFRCQLCSFEIALAH
jgi:hypothetical protein